MHAPLSVVIFGATGDLAKKKLFPALYKLCLHGHLPRSLDVVGYGRSKVDLEAFIEKQCVNIKDDPLYPKREFTTRIRFHAGGYDAPESYRQLSESMRAYEQSHPSGRIGNRLYFLSVPPSVFGTVAQCISQHARATPGGFTRLMIEKPFGKDSSTFDALNRLTAAHFDESQLFRLDHYLGKEVILNIPTLRWANQLFEPTWNAQHIESVQLTFKEDLGTGGRGGYFDSVGIIRDIMQNHLLQAFMWLAMEPPKTMTAAGIIEAKTELLRQVKTLSLDSPSGVFLGQFGRYADEPGYLEDSTVPAGSTCATFAALVLEVDTPRWRGVPFLFTAAKGMDERVCELRVRFRATPTNGMLGVSTQNELVMRIQPHEALYLITTAKEPGITAEQHRKPVVMDMTYAGQFPSSYVGDAYERMFLNAARGDQSLFVSAPELVEAWRIFTPLLHQIDERKPQPVVHPFGYYPRGFMEWAAARGVPVQPTWREFVAIHAGHVEQLTSAFVQLDTNGDGLLDLHELTVLARRFYDGREPTEQQVRRIFDDIDKEKKGSITVEQMVEGAQRMYCAFQYALDDLHPKPHTMDDYQPEVSA